MLPGGGGNIGIVTAFEVNLHPAGTVIGGTVICEATDAEGIKLLFHLELSLTLSMHGLAAPDL